MKKNKKERERSKVNERKRNLIKRNWKNEKDHQKDRKRNRRRINKKLSKGERKIEEK